MTLQLRSISIYSSRGERRDVRFKLGALNILTGAPRTGKSALLDIVDYCWGRKECTIAEGAIRESVSWFAVHLDHNGEGILLARKNSGPARPASDKIYFERGIDSLPETDKNFHKNTTRDGIKDQLSAILGISENVHMPEYWSTRDPLEASSRHAILFCLQGQDEIANRRLLFHRQGEQFIPSAIRDALPYFLGVVDEDHFLTLKRYQDVRSRLRRLERDHREIQSITTEASGAARSLLLEARRSGLLPASATAEDPDSVVALLRQAMEPKEMEFSRIDDPQADLSELEVERGKLRRQLQELREEIRDIEGLRKEASEFENEAREQEARLVSIGLISMTDEQHQGTCPLCESELAVSVPSVSQIRDTLTGIQVQLESVRRDSPRLQERLANLEGQRAGVSEQLRSVQREIAGRIRDNERLRTEKNQFVEQARVVGRITYYLEHTAAVSQESDLPQKIARLRAELEELERTLDDTAAEERLATALSLVGRDLTTYVGRLGLEHGRNPLRLDIKHLTVVSDTDHGPLSLARMGSGQNWVGYHVAAHLGLHELFARQRRPVPGFLMLDQPSQAHYPIEHDDDGNIEHLPDEDRLAVHNLFQVLNEYTRVLQPNMQIIVTDHVQLPYDWFAEATVERWRSGIALVPQSWLAAR